MYNGQEALEPEQNEALTMSAVMLVERCLGDMFRLHAGEALDEAETVLLDEGVLPPSFQPFYDGGFAERFLAVLMTVGWKLRSPHAYALGCVAEEMALHAVVQEARYVMSDVWERAEPEPDFDAATERYRTLDLETFREGALEDEDFLLLWDLDLVDAQDLDQENKLGFTGLRFTEWFKHFDDEDWNVHPIAARIGLGLDERSRRAT